jgi:methylmalonyl-CoA mutase N-terminal domain/subunit
MTTTPAAETPDFKTSSGIEVERYYGPDTHPVSQEDLGDPGRYPFTRGIHPTMYRGRLWTMRQYAGFGTAKETNQRFRWLLKEGQTGLSTAFDLPTQTGLDADHPAAAGEVGRVGVHVGTIGDMETLFADIPLDRVSTSLTINATAPILLAFYLAIAKRRGIPFDSIRGTLQNDVLKEFLARGTYIFPPGPSLRFAVDAIVYSLKNLPLFNPISISGYHIREAGSDAVQEVAFTLANAEAYLKEIERRGIPPERSGERVAFFFGCHNHFLEEIAKFRAARRVWAKMMREDWGVKNPRAQMLRFHVQTCGSTLTSQQPLNNVMRTALQAMAATLGGAQSLHTNAYDEALALPSETSAALALKTQQILAYETGIADTADPTGGSWAIESLTTRLERRIREKIFEIRAKGGMIHLIAQGVPQGEIHEKAYEHSREVDSGRRKIVGVNCLTVPEKKGRLKTLKVAASAESRQKKALAAFKAARNKTTVRKSLDAVSRAAAQPSGDLFVPVLKAVQARATLGEIVAVLREHFGEHRSS